MLKIILYVAGLAVLIALSVWFAETPGAVTVEWHDWRVDTSVAVLFVLIALVLAAGVFLLRAWGAVAGAGRAFRDARKEKRIGRGLDAVTKGFAAVHNSDAAGAARAFRDAQTALGDHSVVRFLEEQVALISGDRAAASAGARTLLDEPAVEGAALRDLAEIALQTGDRESALGHALRAMAKKPPPKWACAMALDLQIALGKWEEAAQTFDRKDVHNAIDDHDQTSMKAKLYGRTAQSMLNRQDTSGAVKWARKAVSANPADPEASAVLALALVGDGKTKKATTELERAWTVQPHPAILSAYLQIAPGEAALARAGRLEKLVTGNPDHPASRLALAEAALAADLWGQARSRLEPLLDEGTASSIRTRAAALMVQVDLGENGEAAASTSALLDALAADTGQPSASSPTSMADLMAGAQSGDFG